MRRTNSAEGAVQPVLFEEPMTPAGFSDANSLLVGVGADVPEMMNWCAGKLGPWSVWNMRSPNVYCSAIWKYGAASAGFTNLNCGVEGGQPVVPELHVTGIKSAPSILPPSYMSMKSAWS